MTVPVYTSIVSPPPPNTMEVGTTNCLVTSHCLHLLCELQTQKTEPASAGPRRTEVASAGPRRTEAASAGPRRKTEAASAGPRRKTEAASVGPRRTEAASAGPRKTEAMAAGPRRTEAASAGLRRTEAASAGPRRTEGGCWTEEEDWGWVGGEAWWHLLMCFSKFGPHFKMVKSERAKKQKKVCWKLPKFNLHLFAFCSGRWTVARQNFHQHHPCASTFFCDLSNKDPWSMCGMQKMKFTWALKLNILLQIHKQLNQKHTQCIAGWFGTILNFN